MEALGPKLRRQRRRLGFTLDELSAKTGISKPYLSLIETGRVPNPPSDEKLRKLEAALSFRTGELVTQAHLQRTPRDVRVVLHKLLRKQARQVEAADEARSRGASPDQSPPGPAASGPIQRPSDHAVDRSAPHADASRAGRPPPANGASVTRDSGHVASTTAWNASVPGPAAPLSRGRSAGGNSDATPLNLDELYLTGALQEFVDRHHGNVETLATNAIPVVNRVSAGYPKDFTDLSYPRQVADEYISCPDISDRDAFAARVHGDSMSPRYTPGDIVIFSPAAATRSGDDCFVRFEDGQTTFKRVFFESDESGKPVLRLQPRNERYRPMTVRPDQVTGLWRAVYKYQRLEAEE